MATNEMWNILVMGCAFMFIFTAFQTTSMIEVRKFVLKQRLLLNFPDLFLMLKARSIVSNGLGIDDYIFVFSPQYYRVSGIKHLHMVSNKNALAKF